MEILIRQILKKDSDAVASLCHQLGYEMSPGLVLENIKKILDHPDHNAFVAMFENGVIGWIGVSHCIQIETLPFCEIRGLVVDNLFRNKGVGKMLIEKSKEWGREKGNKKLRVRCNKKRTETHLFYQHLNFKEIKEQKIFDIEI